MLRTLVLLFTLNALFFPVSGYAGMSEPKSITTVTTNDIVSVKTEEISDSNSTHKCHTAATQDCGGCNTDNMNCNAGCYVHCVNHIISPITAFNSSIMPPSSRKIATSFKHFYSHIISPEHRPPLG